MNREREGLLLCLVSAAGFGAAPIFAKQAFATGLDVTPLLALRFAMAAALLWAFILLRRRSVGSLRALALGAILGACGYAVQAALYFGALKRIDAGLASLLLYAYPAFVTVAAFALRRESPTHRKLGALALASGGVALVLIGGGVGAVSTRPAPPWQSARPRSTPSSSSPPIASRPTRRRCPTRRASPPVRR